MENILTVVLPTYNRKEYLKQAYESLKNQTLKTFDLIIIDNASSDGTKEYLEEIEKENVKCISKQIIINEINVGSVKSGKIAISKVRTDWLTILCDDDYFDEDYIEVMIDAIKKTEKNIILSGFRNVDDNRKVINQIKYEKQILDVNEAMKKVFLTADIEFAGVSGFCFKINDLKKERIIRDYPKGFLTDTMICAEAIINGGGIEILSEVAFNRRIWSNSESSFSSENLKLYNEALLYFNNEMKEMLIDNTSIIPENRDKILKAQPISHFMRITILPIFYKGVLNGKDIVEYFNIFKKNSNYYLHFIILLISYLLCNKFTVVFRKPLKKIYQIIKFRRIVK